METLINGLESILENELVFHGQLLESARLLNKAIKTEDVVKVKEASRKHDELTCQIEVLEEKRLTINDALSSLLGIEKHSNLLRIIDKLPDIRKVKLLQLRTNLKTIIAELKKINTSNQILLNESLYTIAKTFEFIGSAASNTSGYKHQGKKTSSMINRTIINTVA